MLFEIYNTVITYFSGTWGMVELLGTIASLVCVILATYHNQWTWFFGAIGVILFGALFFEFKLYSDAGLQLLFFLPMQIWGFIKWKSLAEQADNDSLTLSLPGFTLFVICVSIFTLSGINGYLMATFTDASFPYADAWTTWMSVFAQILMIKKYWESWMLWVTMDAVAIYIYFAKGLIVVSGLYVLFFMIAAYGLYRWYQDWRKTMSINVFFIDDLVRN